MTRPRTADAAEVVVIGAGPAGCACALAFARRGARVTVLEAGRSSPRRLAGEWVQPAGVEALRRIGVDLVDHAGGTPNRGFVMHPGDGTAPIALPYPEGGAVSLSHARLTEVLRHAVTEHPGIELTAGVRALEADPYGTVRTSRGTVRGRLVVGADGRSSVVRASLARTEPGGGLAPKVPLSHMAGLALDDVPLPAEQYGHIMLGGPGPALAYRLDERTVRLCLDVPLARPDPRELRSYLWHGYADALPAPLRPAMAAQLEAGRVRWAANHFRRRTFYGRGRCALVGDAAGHTHPLVASGLSAAFLDAECLARSAGVAAYARERTLQCWTSDRLGASIHRILTEHTPATRALRRAMFAMWRGDTGKRDRSLRLLAMTENRNRTFAAAFLDVLTRAVSSSAHHAVTTGRWEELAQEIAGYLTWLEWLGGPRAGIPPKQYGRRPLMTFLGP
ncbi:FAD-dependent oxidoreductase [Streptomyces gobitricini]|uniref:FAD-binding domain-containing protein n=1 Tax=Streptomyces gobitricini TaxID=68211 RepID=A0ABP6A7I1_9ACTN